MELVQFSEIWCLDFEFQAPAGERPKPVCLVAREHRSGNTIRWWSDEIASSENPPFPTGRDTLIVSYFASAELGCFLAAGWPFPENVLDLYVEFRCRTNGLYLPSGAGLVGALQYFGLPSIESAQKDAMRELVMGRDSHSACERQQILDYCESDVLALANLLDRMKCDIDLPRALLRGRYMKSVARMEWNGVPVESDVLHRLRHSWEEIQIKLIEAVDSDYGVYEGTTFKRDRFAIWLTELGLSWPRLESGSLKLDEETFQDMAQRYPKLAPLRELRRTLGELRLEKLSVGGDGRNRCLLSPFRSKTSRNQPSNSHFIFGPSCWLRGLIKPAVGRAVAYIDWSQQEFGIAAALSGDEKMKVAYSSGDPYLTFAKQAGAVPDNATKQSHPTEREQFKTCVLGVQYGMGELSLAQKLGEPPARARELLRMHRQTYPVYWDWSQAAVDYALLRGSLHTVFGWRIHTGPGVNPRGLANFPMQANGAEMLRLACCYTTEQGIQVCAPVHDALLVEGPADSIEMIVAETQNAMLRASRDVLDGFELRSDAEIVKYPNRYMDPRGQKMWDTIVAILGDLEDPHPRTNAEQPTHKC